MSTKGEHFQNTSEARNLDLISSVVKGQTKTEFSVEYSEVVISCCIHNI